MIDNHFLWQNQSAEINQKHGRKKTLTSCQSLFKIKLPNCLLYLAGGDGIAAAEYLFTGTPTEKVQVSMRRHLAEYLQPAEILLFPEIILGKKQLSFEACLLYVSLCT